MSPCPRSTLVRDEAERERYAGHAIAAGSKYKVDPDLLIVWFFNESSLNPKAEGTRGEIGVSQIHGKRNRSICKAAGHSLNTPRGQFMCGALLIDMGRRACGDLKRGLYTYACRTCSGCPRGIRAYNYRKNQLERLRQKYRKSVVRTDNGGLSSRTDRVVRGGVSKTRDTKRGRVARPNRVHRGQGGRVRDKARDAGEAEQTTRGSYKPAP